MWENTKRVHTSSQLIIDVRILFSGHTEQGGDAVSVRVPVRETPDARRGRGFCKSRHDWRLEGDLQSWRGIGIGQL